MLFRKFFSWLVISALLAPTSIPPAAAQTVVRAGTTAVPWASNISCSPGQFVAASPDNLHVFKAVNLTPGTAGNTQPTWNIFAGAITVDGTCAWQEQGTLGLPGSGGVQSGPPQTLTNCTAAGTTLNEGVQFSTQLISGVTSLCGTTAAAGSISVVGVCQTGCGNAGAAQIAYSGYQSGIFDNQTTQNDYVIPSATNPGQFTDIGATVPASTTENVGIVASTNTGPGTIATIFLAPLSLLARGSSGGSGVVNPPGCANGIAYYPGLGAVISSDCNFTTNGQGDFIAHSGTFNDVLHAGYVNFIQGPAPVAAPATGVQIAAPTSVTGHTIYLPGSAQTGCATWGVFAGQPQLQGTGVACGAGAGSVTSFGAGNLSPLFTTSVANPNTTPVLSFALSNAIANSILGNFSNSSATPSYNAMSACGDSTHALSYILGTGFGCQLIAGGLPTTQIANPTAPTLTNQNAAGARSITYLVVALERDDSFYHSAASSTTTIANANASPQVLLSAYGDTLYGARCFDIYVTADSGGRTLGKIAHCVGKKFIDTAAAGDTTTAPVDNNSVLTINMNHNPGCNIPPNGIVGVDAPPCIPTSADDEMQQTFGAPGDSQDPFWTWGNQHGAVATWTGGALIFKPDTNAENEYLTNAIALPAPPYTFYVYVDLGIYAGNGAGNGCLIGLRESGTGKIATLELDNIQTSGTVSGQGGYLMLVRNQSSNTTSGQLIFLSYQLNQAYLKIQNNGSGNLIYSYSPTGNGVAYTQVLSQAVTTPFTTTPNQLLIGGLGTGGGNSTCTFDFERRSQ